MRVGIVTIYNSQNCGSFLQSLALLTYVKELGYDTAIAKNKMYYKNKLFYRCMMSFKYILKGQMKKAARILKTSAGFSRCRKKHHNYRLVKNNDLCIYGSDTIWNFDDDYFGKEWRHYWGLGYGGKKIAYAPSIGPTDAEKIVENPQLCDCIKDFSSLSVRDEGTYRVVSSVLGEKADVPYVVDPTMLMPRVFYEGIANECKDRDFILFYYFGAVDKAYMQEIKSYAEKNGKRLICFGDNITGVDKNVCFNPLDMLGYYAAADMIITNTFHGNVFSLIFNKPFVNIDAGKAKVDDLLLQFELSGRTSKSPQDFLKIASENIDFANANRLLAEKRAFSADYIKNALKKCEGSVNNAC